MYVCVPVCVCVCVGVCLCVCDSADLKPLSVEVGEASTLMLLGAEQENAALRRRLEELQAQREVRGHGRVRREKGAGS